MELKRIKAGCILFSVKFYFSTLNDFLVITDGILGLVIFQHIICKYRFKNA